VVLELWKVEQIYWGSFEMGRWRRLEGISLTDCVRNEELQTVREERNILRTKKEGRLAGLVTSCVGTAL
jgi:hypothetical protein